MILSSKKSVRNDILLISSLLIICVIAGFVFHLFSANGGTVNVTVNGKTLGQYSLSEDMTLDIRTGENDIHSNRLVIKDGKVFIESADCPDGICAKHRPISKEGESIVCLPHRVIVTIESKPSDNKTDVVV